MTSTTLLQLPLLAASQAQKHVTHNESLLRLDGLIQMSAASAATASQPASPADGDLYLLPPGKTGSSWGGAADHAIAHFYDGIWHLISPREGWVAFVRDDQTLRVFDGASWAIATHLPAARPAFFAKRSTTLANQTGDMTVADVVFDTARFDHGGDYNAATGVFSAPISGKYLFSVNVMLENLDAAAHARFDLYIATSNQTYVVTGNPGLYELGTGLGLFPVSATVLADMDAGDTARVQVYVNGASKTVGIFSNGSDSHSYFCGSLVS